jgi:hypothetical protein
MFVTMLHVKAEEGSTVKQSFCILHTANSLQGDEAYLRSCQLCSYSRISPHFMEPKSSLLYLSILLDKYIICFI